MGNGPLRRQRHKGIEVVENGRGLVVIQEKDFRSGLAWRLTDDGISWHTGSAGAFSAWLGLSRSNKTAVFIGTNYGLADVENPGLNLLRSL